ncbi:MAG TPA: alpha/beta hydrolase [Nocardioidaceae bacterium]|nr:alpha/beta hydrolase [Nocardioidaceae bacterium]
MSVINVAWRGVELYMRGLSNRRMTLPEVTAFRGMAELYLAQAMFRPDPSTEVEQVRVPHDGGQVHGEWVERGPSTRDSSVVLYVHGGAFVAFSPRTHRGMVSEIAARTGRSVFSVDYRMAPEYRFPSAADDVLRAYSWLLASGVPASQIVVAGDSAGGHLALGLTPRAVRAGLPAPAAVVGISPLVDPSMELASGWVAARGRPDSFTPAARATVGLYPRRMPLDHPELLLTNDDLSVMPPTLIQVSASEPLMADAEAYVEAMRAAGGDVSLHSWKGKPHVFQIAFRVSKTASEALDELAAFALSKVGTVRTADTSLRNPQDR